MNSVLDALKEARAEVEANTKKGTEFSRAIMYAPKEGGGNLIRILPPHPDRPGKFYRTIAQHWNVNAESAAPVICTRHTKDLADAGAPDCPVCKLIDALQSHKGDPLVDKILSDIVVKKAWLFNIVDLKDAKYTQKDYDEWMEKWGTTKEGEERDCPFEVGGLKTKVYSAPISVFDGITKFMSQSQVDITHPDHGYNMFVNKESKSKKQNFVKYTVTAQVPSKPIDLPEGFEVYDLNSFGWVRTPEEINDLIANGVGLGVPDHMLPSGMASSGKALTSGSKGKSSSKSSSHNKPVDDVADAADSEELQGALEKEEAPVTKGKSKAKTIEELEAEINSLINSKKG